MTVTILNEVLSALGLSNEHPPKHLPGAGHLLVADERGSEVEVRAVVRAAGYGIVRSALRKTDIHGQGGGVWMILLLHGFLSELF